VFAALNDERPAPRRPLEEQVRAAGLRVARAADVDVPYEADDIVAALRDGSGFDADIETVVAPVPPARRHVSLREPVPLRRRDAVVVEAHQRDHVAHVVLVLDPPRPKPGLPGNTGWYVTRPAA